MTYDLRTADHLGTEPEVVARHIPGPLPSFPDVVEVDGNRWRVLEIRHVVHTADDGYRRVDHVAVVEPE